LTIQSGHFNFRVALEADNSSAPKLISSRQRLQHKETDIS
jgi:hypothetical protein